MLSLIYLLSFIINRVIVYLHSPPAYELDDLYSFFLISFKAEHMENSLKFTQECECVCGNVCKRERDR